MNAPDAHERRGNSTGNTAIPVGSTVGTNGAGTAVRAEGAADAGAEWSIQHIAKLAGTTSRTLRH